MLKLILSLPLFIALSFSGNAKTITVCPDCKVSSITEALAIANDGDSITVKKGVYKEGNIMITKEVSLVGIDFPVVDGDNSSEIFTIHADNVTLTGFQIQNVGVNFLKDEAGINVVKRKGCIIANNRLFNTFFGIYLRNSKDCVIRDNEIIGKAEQEINSGNAIQLWYCENILVEGNTAKNHRDGIYLEFVDNSQIISNISENNLRYGLHFMFSNGDKYFYNTFKNNGAGVAVMFSKQIEMKHNDFDRNWGSASYGLLLKEIYDSKIENNNFVENTVGIYAEGATRCSVKENTFKQNGWACKILGSSMDNVFTMNNFLSNSFDISTNSTRNYNSYSGNYWNEYTGYDLDKDGIGDVPYRPVKLFSYVVGRVQPAIILLRSFFVDLINFAEKVSPAYTPQTLVDEKPLMKPVL